MIFAISGLAAACLWLPQDPKPEPADPIVPAKVAAQRIEDALAAGVAPACSTIEEFGSRKDPLVVKALGKALRHKQDEVKIASIQALRFHGTKAAFKELMRHRANRLIIEREDPAAAYYLALGQYADLDALPVLAKNLRSLFKNDKKTAAQVLALGRMRHTKAIEALIKFLRSPLRRSPKARSHAVLSLYVLTGHAGGNKGLGWAAWWKANRRDFAFPRREPKLSRSQERTWKTLWTTPEEQAAAAASKKGSKDKKKKARRKRRQERGDGKGEGKSDAGDGEKADGARLGKRAGRLTAA